MLFGKIDVQWLVLDARISMKYTAHPAKLTLHRAVTAVVYFGAIRKGLRRSRIQCMSEKFVDWSK